MKLSFPKPRRRHELSDAIKRISSQGSGGARFFLLIDGLDEYQGPPSDLVEDLGWLASSPSVKLCVSSRPRNVFADLYGSPRHLFQLVLQEHTADDIRRFIRQRLFSNHKFQALMARDPTAICVVDEIQELSSGVFL
jgi:hypothetical protein